MRRPLQLNRPRAQQVHLQKVDCGDPLGWPVVRQARVFSQLNTIRLSNPVHPVSSPNFGDCSVIPTELPVWTPEGFVWRSVDNTNLRV